MKRVAIVGGGVAGLALAHALGKKGAPARGVEALVLEGSPRAGGNIKTEVTDGYLLEAGPNGFLDSVPETLDLVRDLGLEGELLVSHDRARRRYIFRRGRLHPLPGGPGAFLSSDLLSWPGKLRLVLEPLARPRPEGDETIHAFASRRIGREAAEFLIDPMVSGVFGGDARRLSLRACFPAMWQMETDHGGLLRALLAKMWKKRKRGRTEPLGAPPGRLTSFREGTETLVQALARARGDTLQTGAPVRSLTPAGGGYELALEGGGRVAADAVVLAGGAGESARIVEGLDGELASLLRGIPSAPLAVVCLGYAESSLPRALDGFGFLIPRGEGPRILGVLWDSSIYPGRAPSGRVLLRAMIGGAHDEGVLALDDAALLSVVRKDLKTTMGLDADPALVRIFRHPGGIPQYTVGHLDRLARAEARLERHPGVYLAGCAYRGVAINSCVAEAGPRAGLILSRLSPD
ncbi:MAG TPA: protoporphyrinogen oxidase [Vicinamibacteria bacterium]|nr:protoporphyrinogen oxidase [Vicinamibacteria bacterium]